MIKYDNNVMTQKILSHKRKKYGIINGHIEELLFVSATQRSYLMLGAYAFLEFISFVNLIC